MTVTVQSVLDRVQQTLQDTAGIRWSSTNELVLWVNDAQREIALLKPDATATNATVALVEGTKQTIPDDGNRLLRVVRNMAMIEKTYTVTVVNSGGNKFYIDGSFQTLTLEEGSTYTFDQSDSSNSGHPLRFSTTANGSHGGGSEYTTGVTTSGTPGSGTAFTKITVAVGAPTLYTYCTQHAGMGFQVNTGTRVGTGKRATRLVSRDSLDSIQPSWHDPTVKGDAKHGSLIKHYMYEDQNPRNYYVYPGVASGASSFLEIIYSANPTTVAANGNLDVPDVFANAVMNYVLYMAYMKDSEFVGNQQRASAHYNLFITSVTGKSQIDLTTTPNLDVGNQAQATTMRGMGVN
tara:strand:+ start:2964 stop:4010 length:1047 start_codon:yes stop_codon:yes gene_type:complete